MKISRLPPKELPVTVALAVIAWILTFLVVALLTLVMNTYSVLKTLLVNIRVRVNRYGIDEETSFTAVEESTGH